MLTISTIVLDGMPWIGQMMPIFEALKCKWRWLVTEGVSMPVADTRWVKRLEPRLSTDGTTKFLQSISRHPNVSVEQRDLWNGKTQQINHWLPSIKEQCVLMQIDADEVWKTGQLEQIIELFAEQPALAEMAFRCRYFVGPKLAITMDCHDQNSWIRAWRFVPGCRFRSHEPPLLGGIHGQVMESPETAELGLIFDHFAYAHAEQVALKEKYYGYEGALKRWKALQKVKSFPVRVADYLPWAHKNSLAEPVNL